MSKNVESKVSYIGRKVSPEVDRGLRLLHEMGYGIQRHKKGYYEIFKQDDLLGKHRVGTTKNSSLWIDSIRHFNIELKACKRCIGRDPSEKEKAESRRAYKLFKEFLVHLDVFEIPYPFGKNGPGIEYFEQFIKKTLIKGRLEIS